VSFYGGLVEIHKILVAESKTWSYEPSFYYYYYYYFKW